MPLAVCVQTRLENNGCYLEFKDLVFTLSQNILIRLTQQQFHERRKPMKSTESVHKKVQEMCDCYATTDPLREMSVLKNDADKEEAAVKWLALVALHGVNNNAEKISIRRSGDGKVTVYAEYRTTELPSPGGEVGQKILEAVRGMTHIDGEKGKTDLALGMRESSIDLRVKLKKKEGGEQVTLTFPE
jgi:hypothetical protein